MHVIFVEPAFPHNQRQFVRALAAVGARVIGIGERPRDALDDELKSWLTEYLQIRSVVDEAALARGGASRAASGLGRSPGSDRRGAHHAGGEGAGNLRHSGHLGAHGLALPRQAVDEGGAARGRHSLRAIGERRQSGGRARVRAPRRLSAHLQAARRRGRLRHDAHRQRQRSSSSAIASFGVDRGQSIAVEEFIEGHEGFLDTLDDPRRGGARVRQSLLPERARGHARALDLAADHRDQSHQRGGLRRSEAARAARDRGARDRHFGDAHGMVLRTEGPEVLRDRLPSAGRWPVGRVLPRPTTSTSTASGPWRSCTARPVSRCRAATRAA